MKLPTVPVLAVFGLWTLLPPALAFGSGPPQNPQTAKGQQVDQAEAAGVDGATSGEDSSDAQEFIRLMRDSGGDPTSMQTAIVRYTRREAGQDGPTKKGLEPVTVDLIAVVHIAEQAYYEQLNKRFEDYDGLLYEMVAPEGARITRDEDRDESLVSMVQRGLKGMLDLEFQLDWIDYECDNFVHADMTPQEFSQSMSDRGESIWTIVFRVLQQSMAQQAGGSDRAMEVELVRALFDDQRAVRLKRILAEQFEDLEAAMSVFDGPDGSVIVTERNKKALSVLEKQIKKGQRRLAIFYGAGHMPDMERRLVEEMGFERGEAEWLTAWNLELSQAEAESTAEDAAEPTAE